MAEVAQALGYVDAALQRMLHLAQSLRDLVTVASRVCPCCNVQIQGQWVKNVLQKHVDARGRVEMSNMG